MVQRGRVGSKGMNKSRSEEKKLNKTLSQRGMKMVTGMLARIKLLKTPDALESNSTK